MSQASCTHTHTHTPKSQYRKHTKGTHQGLMVPEVTSPISIPAASKILVWAAAVSHTNSKGVDVGLWVCKNDAGKDGWDHERGYRGRREGK
jgi:hypothetical protein